VYLSKAGHIIIAMPVTTSTIAGTSHQTDASSHAVPSSLSPPSLAPRRGMRRKNIQKAPKNVVAAPAIIRIAG
jgi:hypothetical protein